MTILIFSSTFDKHVNHDRTLKDLKNKNFFGKRLCVRKVNDSSMDCMSVCGSGIYCIENCDHKNKKMLKNI